MQYKLITLNLNDYNYKYIKDLKRELFFQTNDPSFNIFPNLLILGYTQLNHFNNINISSLKDNLKFDTQIASLNNFSYIDCLNKNIITEIKTQVCIDKNIKINSPYFNIDIPFSELPILHLGNKLDVKKNINQITIKDYRLSIYTINIENNLISYKKLDSIHLS